MILSLDTFTQDQRGFTLKSLVTSEIDIHGQSIMIEMSLTVHNQPWAFCVLLKPIFKLKKIEFLLSPVLHCFLIAVMIVVGWVIVSDIRHHHRSSLTLKSRDVCTAAGLSPGRWVVRVTRSQFPSAVKLTLHQFPHSHLVHACHLLQHFRGSSCTSTARFVPIHVRGLCSSHPSKRRLGWSPV